MKNSCQGWTRIQFYARDGSRDGMGRETPRHVISPQRRKDAEDNAEKTKAKPERRGSRERRARRAACGLGRGEFPERTPNREQGRSSETRRQRYDSTAGGIGRSRTRGGRCCRGWWSGLRGG